MRFHDLAKPRISMVREALFFGYHELVARDGIWRKYRRLNSSQWWQPGHLAELQATKLLKLLTHCKQHVPFYRDRDVEYASTSSPDWMEVLQQQPFITKSLIRRNREALTALNYAASDVVESSTSGSTGESLCFLVDKKRSAIRRSAAYRTYGWCGVSLMAREALLWGARFDEPNRAGLRSRLQATLKPLLFLSSYDLSESSMEGYLERLRCFNPAVLLSYPSPLEVFSRYCLERSARIPGLRAVICSAEKLFPHQRELIERSLGVPVFDRYGSREFSTIAHECEVRNGLHIAAERLIVEVVRDDGTCCPEGETGELVITDLDNYAMPFVRYRTGDRGRLSGRQCTCGRGLPILEEVEGRVLDMVRTPSGGTISGTFWTLMSRHVSSRILQFQVVQTRLEQIEFRLVTYGGMLSEPEEHELLRRIGEVAPDLAVNIAYVEHIPAPRSGKRRFVISQLTDAGGHPGR